MNRPNPKRRRRMARWKLADPNSFWEYMKSRWNHEQGCSEWNSENDQSMLDQQPLMSGGKHETCGDGKIWERDGIPPPPIEEPSDIEEYDMITSDDGVIIEPPEEERDVDSQHWGEDIGLRKSYSISDFRRQGLPQDTESPSPRSSI